MPERLPRMSVVVISYNGATLLPTVLQSLRNQTYPRNRYEIILVDDGSTDDTPDVATHFPDVRYVRLANNQGISAARNAGLRACRGDIYVGFDDDCVAEPDWLEQLAKSYQTGNPAGVGGTLTMPHTRLGITSLYLSMSDYYVGARQLHGQQQQARPWHRLWRYLRGGTQPPLLQRRPIVVNELYGANSSFPCAVLRAVGGWQVNMSGVEDRDICYRIRRAFPGRPFYQTSHARLMHTGQHQTSSYLLRPLKRGPMNLKFYRSVHEVPPIFPFPLIFITVILLALIAAPLLAVPLAIVLPPVLYFWWPYRAWRHHRPLAVSFAYFQLIEELLVIIGLIRGYLTLPLNRFDVGN